MVGKSPAMREIFGLIERIAPTDATVLIEGETGTGKDMVARTHAPAVAARGRAVHRRRLRRGRRHADRERAVRPREGRVHRRDRRAPGRVRAGARRHRVPRRARRAVARSAAQAPARARAARGPPRRRQRRRSRSTCASSRRPRKDLRSEVEKGKFREDLYFRLNVVPITAPPLRERREDIPLLIDAFLAQARRPGGAARARRRDACRADGARLAGQRARAAQRDRARRLLSPARGERRAGQAVSTPSGAIGQLRGGGGAVRRVAESYRDNKEKWENEFEQRYLTWL